MANLALPFIVTILALAVSIGEAVRCYDCSTDRDFACADPFYGQHQLPLIECDNYQRGNNPNQQQYLGGNARSVCKKTKIRQPNGQYSVRRTCAFEYGYGQGDPCANEYNSYSYGAECSVCRYDACNGASSFAPAYHWVIATTAAIYLFVKCLN